MDDFDLRDTRGRLKRLALAAAFALLVTSFVMRWINSVSRPANHDPIGSATVPLLAIGMFVVVTALGTKALTRFARR